MSFLSGKDLEVALFNALGAQFDPQAIKQAAYQLSLDAEYFTTDSDGQLGILDDKKKLVEINPGQVCLLLTQETIAVPNTLMAFISMRANEKFKGLVNISGFHLDPGFNGKVLFSVYNAGPSTISLKKGEQYFLLWFSKISQELSEEDAYNDKKNTHQKQDSIPLRYIDALKHGEITSPNVLLKKIETVEQEVIKRHIRLEVVASILLTIAIGLGTKACSDNRNFERGYAKRIEEEALINEMRAAKLLSVDSNLLKIDTLNAKLQRLRKTISPNPIP